MDRGNIVLLNLVQVWAQVEAWYGFTAESQGAQFRVSKNFDSRNFSQGLCCFFSGFNDCLSVYFVGFLSVSCESIPSSWTCKAVSRSAIWWCTIKSSTPFWVYVIHAMSKFSGLKKYGWDSLGRQSKLMMIEWNRSYSLCINIKSLLMLRIECSYKTSKTTINVDTNIMLQTEFGQLCNRIDYAVWIVWIWTND